MSNALNRFRIETNTMMNLAVSKKSENVLTERFHYYVASDHILVYLPSVLIKRSTCLSSCSKHYRTEKKLPRLALKETNSEAV